MDGGRLVGGWGELFCTVYTILTMKSALEYDILIYFQAKGYSII